MAYWATISKSMQAGGTAFAFALLLAGCHPDMWDQPRYDTFTRQADSENGASWRLPVDGAMTYEGARRPWTSVTFAENTKTPVVPVNSDDRFWTGKNPDASFAGDNYFHVDAKLLARGKERFAITCQPCHGHLGDGQGLITTRGFPAPPSYHIDRLREIEDGYIFDVITRGFGRMYSYAARVAPEDRWAIAAYIRALQYSQDAKLADLSPAEREKIQNPKPAEKKESGGEGHAGAEHAH